MSERRETVRGIERKIESAEKRKTKISEDLDKLKKELSAKITEISELEKQKVTLEAEELKRGILSDCINKHKMSRYEIQMIMELGVKIHGKLDALSINEIVQAVDGIYKSKNQAEIVEVLSAEPEKNDDSAKTVAINSIIAEQ